MQAEERPEKEVDDKIPDADNVDRDRSEASSDPPSNTL